MRLPVLLKFMDFITNVIINDNVGKNKYHVKIWKCFLASFANLPIAALI